MFTKVREATTHADIRNVAEDIWNHSDIDTLEANSFTYAKLLDLLMEATK